VHRRARSSKAKRAGGLPVERWLRRRRVRRGVLTIAAVGLAGLLLWSLGGTEAVTTVRLRGRVVEICDAMTLRVRDQTGHERKVRLEMVEVPPTWQAAARRWLAERLIGREVTLVLIAGGEDGAATPGAMVYRDDGPLINEEMIDRGYARFAGPVDGSLTDDQAKLADWLGRVERWARADGRGLWAKASATGE
jgi:endonuclease YncB( thermonuclease family)